MTVINDMRCYGSIPACAGEPSGDSELYKIDRVYPRVCGGTTVSCDAVFFIRGLSPRVRGNPNSGYGCHTSSRSIPACAGEPLCAWLLRPRYWVYPRVCGGT